MKLNKHLSIGLGLALSFGNVIAASPSFANTCATINGQTICSTNSTQNRIPASAVPKLLKKDDLRTLPDGLVNSNGQIIPKRLPEKFPQPEPRPVN